MAFLVDDAFAHPLSANLAHTGDVRHRFDVLGIVRGVKGVATVDGLAFDDGFSVSFTGAARRAEAEERIPATTSWAQGRCDDRCRRLDVEQAAAGTLLRFSALSGAAGDGPRNAAPEKRANDAARAVLDRFRTAAPEIVVALQSDAPERAVAAALRLVGLGPGLTPAGDDFLVGLAAAAWFRTGLAAGVPEKLNEKTVAAWLDLVLDAAGGPVPRTGDVSLSFLRLAQRRLFSRALVGLSRSFVPGAEERTFDDAVALLRRLGHSSGLDAATGFLFGLKSIGPRSSRIQG